MKSRESRARFLTRCSLLLALVALLALTVSTSALARSEPDVVDFVHTWLRGGWRSPLLCTFEGQPIQGVRRVLITPGPQQSEHRVARIAFTPLEAREAERCRSLLGGEAPNLVGHLLVTYIQKRQHSDTPRRDFDLLRREGRFELAVVSGRLRIGPAQRAPADLPEVDFAGGRVEVGEIPPNSDTARLLIDFGAMRRLWLALEAPDGTRIELPLVLFEGR
jgi:hypothetical protein